MNVYIAGALHEEDQRRCLEELRVLFLAAGHNVYLPHRDGGRYSVMLEEGMSRDIAAMTVYGGDRMALQWCDCVVAVFFDGVTDPGVAFELGFANAIGRKNYSLSVGLRFPDKAEALDLNPMLYATITAHASHGIGLLNIIDFYHQRT